jgi:hypothetical protein
VEIESALIEAGHLATLIRRLIPAQKDVIGTRVSAGTRGITFSFKGLDFVRWSREGIFFGLGDARELLRPSTEQAFERLVRSLMLHRTAVSTQKNHKLFRAAPERWLETMIREDPAKLDAHLDVRHLYAQTPALTVGDRGVLDLLGVTRRGRLGRRDVTLADFRRKIAGKKLGKRPGLNQNHFPGCVLEVFDYLDAAG